MMILGEFDMGKPSKLAIILALSVALNLLLIGVIVGALGKGAPHDARQASVGMRQIVGALPPSDRRILRNALRGQGRALGGSRKRAKQSGAQLQAALRADPFDPAAFAAALRARDAYRAALSDAGRATLIDIVTQMSDTDRAAFAQRLTQGRKRPKRKE